MILASISPRRTTRDPFPWLWPSGRRTADAGPLDWVELGDGARMRPSRARYAPRTHPPYRAVPVHPVNPILDVARDSWDGADEWGSALAWAHAACSVLAYLGEPVPSEWGYRPSMAGPAADLSEGWEAAETVTVLGLGRAMGGDLPAELTDPDDIPADTWRLAGEYARHAARVLMRLAHAVPESDRY